MVEPYFEDFESRRVNFVPMSLKVSKIIVSVRSSVGSVLLRGYLRGYNNISRSWNSAIERASSIWGSEKIIFWERTSTGLLRLGVFLETTWWTIGMVLRVR